MPIRTISDRTRTRTKTPLTSTESISGLRVPRRGAQGGVGLPDPEEQRSGGRLQNAIIAFQPPCWYPTERPHALRRATRARWVASAFTTTGARHCRWVPPPGEPQHASGGGAARPPRARRAWCAGLGGSWHHVKHPPTSGRARAPSAGGSRAPPWPWACAWPWRAVRRTSHQTPHSHREPLVWSPVVECGASARGRAR